MDTRKFLNVWSRKLHRWGAVATLVPLAFIIGAGLLLQVKKQLTWVQPATMRGESSGEPAIAFAELLDVVRGVPEAEVVSWDDIDRVDVQPGRGMAKVLSANSWEVQVDLATGEVLQVAYRRSDLIESLHDGSFFGDFAKLGVFLPTGVVLLGLWATGVYLWVLPYLARARGRRVRAARAQASEAP